MSAIKWPRRNEKYRSDEKNGGVEVNHGIKLAIHDANEDAADSRDDSKEIKDFREQFFALIVYFILFKIVVDGSYFMHSGQQRLSREKTGIIYGNYKKIK